LGKVGYEGTSDEATLKGKAQGKADLRQLQLENAAKNKIELQLLGVIKVFTLTFTEFIYNTQFHTQTTNINYFQEN